MQPAETTTDRTTIKQWLRDTTPRKVIAPFGIDPEYFQDGQIITRKEYVPITGERRTNEQIHAKLIIGENTVLTGSCNFTPHSVNVAHEIVHRFHDTQTRETLIAFFEDLWKRSTPCEGINSLV